MISRKVGKTLSHTLKEMKKLDNEYEAMVSNNKIKSSEINNSIKKKSKKFNEISNKRIKHFDFIRNK
ncbi:hypothetical protein ABE096_14220 [Robertmurraya massiliosenegalensis]|uniref:hypothetical protein n=1 Tax=Robertmurraya TaxID=2837507 RepID=UPI0039A60CCA